MNTNNYYELKQYKRDLNNAGIDEKFHRSHISTVMSIGTWREPKPELRNHREYFHNSLLEEISQASYDYEIYRAISDLSLREAFASILTKSVASFGVYFLGQVLVAGANPAFQDDVSNLVTILASVPLIIGSAKGVREANNAYNITRDCEADNDGQNPVGGIQ